jgi:predicted flap endonuclease-1-like 5' DNA nuclease
VIERDKLKKKNQELEAKNEYLQKEQQSSIKDKKDMELHTKELSTLKSDIKRYKDENFNLKRELDEIKEKFKSKKRQIGELEEKFRKEKERYKDIDDDIASYKRRISELENQKLSLEEQMRSKFKEGNKSSELQGEIDSLKQDLKNDKLTILRLRAEGRDKEQEHNRQLLKSQEEIEQLKNKLKNLQKDDKHGMKKPSFLKEPNGKPDNLELIKGIGSTLHKVLNELGVFHFEQIASWSKKEIAWVNDHLAFSGRIEREEWVQQAKKLLKGEQTEVSKEKKSNKRFKHSKHLRKK